MTKQSKQSKISLSRNGISTAVCSRCGHVFKPEKPVKECPDCGFTVGVIVDGELEWSSEMREPIPQFVYDAQSPEEIFYKTLKWYYQKWIAQFKGNPSSRIK
jgi:ribosomal protein L37E